MPWKAAACPEMALTTQFGKSVNQFICLSWMDRSQ